MIQEIVHPRHIFEELEKIWTQEQSRRNTSHTPRTSKKRVRDIASDTDSVVSQSKRTKSFEHDQGLPLSDTDVSCTQSELGEQEVQVDAVSESHEETTTVDEDDHGDASETSEEDAETRMPARSAAWKAQWTKVEAFRRRQYFLATVGSYAITCPLIEDRFPGFEGQLRLHITIRPNTENDGILTACLDLGLFEGILVLGTEEDRLHVWCHEKSRPGKRPNPESRRLEQRSRAAKRRIKAKASTNSGSIDPVNIGFDEAPSFWGEYRCRDDRGLFSGSEVVFSNKSCIWLQDKAGMHIEGDICLPMLSDDPVVFEGFKVQESPAVKTGANSWAEYNTAIIRFGPSWKD